MKKISMLLTVVMVISMLCGTIAYGTDTPEAGGVEIIFKVGDSVLSINGSNVPVETPFVVNGVTMVPLRVISEAFGSEVGWDDVTQTITITYGDVTIVLQIANKQATVNGQTGELPEAPTLSESGRTMVPLRFISETFGATVEFDEKTEGIKVIKAADKQEDTSGSTIQSSFNKTNIGDSYYKWSMETPKTMTLIDRTFNGSETVFEKQDDKARLTIHAEKDTTKDNTPDKELKEIKEYFEGGTVIKAEKTTLNGEQCVIYQGKGKDSYVDSRIFLKNGNRLEIYFYIDVNASNEKRKEYTAILDTFKPTFVYSEDIEDMSNVENGYRPFEDNKYGLKLKLPADWERTGSVNKENDFTFAKYSDDGKILARAYIGVFSISPSLSTPEAWAKRDLQGNTRYMNTKYFAATEVMETTAAGKNAYEYTVEYKLKLASAQSTLRDIFYYDGEYGYNISLTTYKSYARGTSEVKEILASLTTETLDEDEIGDLMTPTFESLDVTEVYKSDQYKFSIEVPAEWQEISLTAPAYTDPRSGVTVSASSWEEANADAGAAARNTETNFRDDGGRIISSPKVCKIGDFTGYTLTCERKMDNGEAIILTYYYMSANGRIYMLFTYSTEEFRDSEMDDVLAKIVASFKPIKE